MKIEDPIANYGDRVDVENYRSSLAPIETGIVRGLEYSNHFGGKFDWAYRVRLDRMSRHGKPIHLYVGKGKIWKHE